MELGQHAARQHCSDLMTLQCEQVELRQHAPRQQCYALRTLQGYDMDCVRVRARARAFFVVLFFCRGRRTSLRAPPVAGSEDELLVQVASTDNHATPTYRPAPPNTDNRKEQQR